MTVRVLVRKQYNSWYLISYSRTPEILDIVHSSATQALYMFIQTPSLSVHEMGLGTRLAVASFVPRPFVYEA